MAKLLAAIFCKYFYWIFPGLLFAFLPWIITLRELWTRLSKVGFFERKSLRLIFVALYILQENFPALLCLAKLEEIWSLLRAFPFTFSKDQKRNFCQPTSRKSDFFRWWRAPKNGVRVQKFLLSHAVKLVKWVFNPETTLDIR